MLAVIPLRHKSATLALTRVKAIVLRVNSQAAALPRLK